MTHQVGEALAEQFGALRVSPPDDDEASASGDHLVRSISAPPQSPAGPRPTARASFASGLAPGVGLGESAASIAAGAAQQDDPQYSYMAGFGGFANGGSSMYSGYAPSPALQPANASTVAGGMGMYPAHFAQGVPGSPYAGAANMGSFGMPADIQQQDMQQQQYAAYYQGGQAMQAPVSPYQQQHQHQHQRFAHQAPASPTASPFSHPLLPQALLRTPPAAAMRLHAFDAAPSPSATGQSQRAAAGRGAFGAMRQTASVPLPMPSLALDAEAEADFQQQQQLQQQQQMLLQQQQQAQYEAMAMAQFSPSFTPGFGMYAYPPSGYYGAGPYAMAAPPSPSMPGMQMMQVPMGMPAQLMMPSMAQLPPSASRSSPQQQQGARYLSTHSGESPLSPGRTGSDGGGDGWPTGQQASTRGSTEPSGTRGGGGRRNGPPVSAPRSSLLEELHMKVRAGQQSAQNGGAGQHSAAQQNGRHGHGGHNGFGPNGFGDADPMAAQLGAAQGGRHQGVRGGPSLQNLLRRASGKGGRGGDGISGSSGGGGCSVEWGLHAIQGQVVEFAKDQHGSRFIQTQLESPSVDPADKDSVVAEILPHAKLLCSDVFGNYVVQKLLSDVGTPAQQESLVRVAIEGNMVAHSNHMYSCRVIQKMVECVFGAQGKAVAARLKAEGDGAPGSELYSQPYQDALLRELDGEVLRCVRDANANHVVQKLLECVRPLSRIDFIFAAFRGNMTALSMHSFGCRVAQRAMENADEERLEPLLAELMRNVEALVRDAFGNYVMQHVISHGSSGGKAPSPTSGDHQQQPQQPPETLQGPAAGGCLARHRRRLMEVVNENVLSFSVHKFSSNVVERCLESGSPAERRALIARMLEPSGPRRSPPLEQMMKDPFANYVLQKALEIADGDQRVQMVSVIQANASALKRLTYGRHILNRLETHRGGGNGNGNGSGNGGRRARGRGHHGQH